MIIVAIDCLIYARTYHWLEIYFLEGPESYPLDFLFIQICNLISIKILDDFISDYLIESIFIVFQNSLGYHKLLLKR